MSRRGEPRERFFTECFFRVCCIFCAAEYRSGMSARRPPAGYVCGVGVFGNRLVFFTHAYCRGLVRLGDSATNTVCWLGTAGSRSFRCFPFSFHALYWYPVLLCYTTAELKWNAYHLLKMRKRCELKRFFAVFAGGQKKKRRATRCCCFCRWFLRASWLRISLVGARQDEKRAISLQEIVVGENPKGPNK